MVILAILLLLLSPNWSVTSAQSQGLESQQADAERLLRKGDEQYRDRFFKDALQTWQQALTIYRNIQQRGALWLDSPDHKNWHDPGEADVLNRLGDTYYFLGKYDQSITYYEQYLALTKELQNSQKSERKRGIEWEGVALIKIGNAFLESGNPTQAIKALLHAKQIWEAEGNFSMGPIFTPLQTTYRLLQKALIAQNQIAAALEIAEQSRFTKCNLSDKTENELISDERLTTLKRQLNPLPDASSLSLEREQEIIREATLIAGHTHCTAPPTIEEIQQIAKEHNATLVEYSIMYDTSWEYTNISYGSTGYIDENGDKQPESETFIWVVKPEGKVAFRQVDLRFLKQQGTSLADLVSRIPHSIGTRGILDDTAREANARENHKVSPHRLLRQFHQLLIEPIADLLPADPEAPIIFIPQGPLFRVPLAALQNASGSYLIQGHTILATPSIKTLRLTHKLRQGLPKLKDVLVVGNPVMPYIPLKFGSPEKRLPSLPGAEEEARAIAAQFKTQALIGKQATKTTVIQQMPKARIIHLATHGLLDNAEEIKMVRGTQDIIHINIEWSFAYMDGSDEPISIEGMLALAPLEKNNGFLTAKEISVLKLNAELVVLSACYTGNGYITAAGVRGLSEAFISGGVPSVIVSLWSAPDAPTTALMIKFYDNLKLHANKASALRQAMLTIMQQYHRPRDWAAFMLIGEAE